MSKTILNHLPAPASGKLRIVLDMDKTLIIAKKVDVRSDDAIHSLESLPGLDVAPNSEGFMGTQKRQPDLLVSNQEIRDMGWPMACDERQIWLRPGLLEFLDTVSEFAEIVVWTLSEFRLALRIIEKLDVRHRISGVVGREINGPAQNFRGYWFKHQEAFTSIPKSVSAKVDGQKRGVKRRFGWASLGGSSSKRPAAAKSAPQQQKAKRGAWKPREYSAEIFLHHLSARRSLPQSLIQETEQYITMEWIKDLSMLNCALGRTVIIEDWAELCIFNPRNAIIVPEFRHPDVQFNDDSLPRIGQLLKTMRHPSVDVRDRLAEQAEGSHGHLLGLTSLLEGHQRYCELRRRWVGPYPSEQGCDKELDGMTAKLLERTDSLSINEQKPRSRSTTVENEQDAPLGTHLTGTMTQVIVAAA